MMGEMIERIAKAMYETRQRIWKEVHPDKDDWFTFETDNDGYRGQLRREAREFIAAMRDPTMEMVEAGQETNNLLEEPDPPNAFKFLSRDEMTDAWQAMIDRALDSRSDI